MKIECHCGAIINDTTDSIPWKAHIIPDQNWDDMFDAVDAAIEQSGPTALAKEAACMRVREVVGKLSRSAWQCRSCGRIYIDDQEYELQHFLPATDDVPRELFRRKKLKSD